MKIVVAGAGGFIAGHLIRQLAKEGHEITAVDIKPLDEWYQVRKLKNVNNLPKVDLKNKKHVSQLIANKDRVYNLACNMGGMGFIQNNHIDCLEGILGLHYGKLLKQCVLSFKLAPIFHQQFHTCHKRFSSGTINSIYFFVRCLILPIIC